MPLHLWEVYQDAKVVTLFVPAVSIVFADALVELSAFAGSARIAKLVKTKRSLQMILKSV